MPKRIFVANWKMQLSFNQANAFVQDHYKEFVNLTQDNTIVLCPSFPSLHNLAMQFKQSGIHIGAQNVSRHPSGAYTGQVSAQSLHEIGCSYCIIGHSDNRIYDHDTNIDIVHKLKELLKQHITPIICVGENKAQHDTQQHFEALQDQLMPNLEAIADSNHPIGLYIIAYEPIWAIGTDNTPTIQSLSSVFSWLHNQCSQKTRVPFALLYGGSVHQNNAADILKVSHVDGLLIGRSSVHFDTFKTICNTV